MGICPSAVFAASDCQQQDDQTDDDGGSTSVRPLDLPGHEAAGKDIDTQTVPMPISKMATALRAIRILFPPTLRANPTGLSQGAEGGVDCGTGFPHVDESAVPISSSKNA